MDYSPVNHNKKIYSKHLTIEYKKPLCNSENNDNDNELKSKNSNIDKETLNLFKGIVKLTKRTLNEKQTPETKSNTLNNNNNNIFDFTNYLYNNEEHLDKDKLCIIANTKNIHSYRHDKVISPSPTLKPRNKVFDKSRSSLHLSNLSKNAISKEKNLKSSLFKINSNQLSLNNYYKNNNTKRKPKRESIIRNMTHKNKNNQNFNFFFKLKEKEKIPSKTPYLDKIWNFSNQLNFKPQTNTNTKKESGLSIIKQNSQEINPIKINNTNIKCEKEKKDEIIKKTMDKLEKDKDNKNGDIKQEEKNGGNTDKKFDKKSKIFLSEEKAKKTNIIFSILNKPFFCCLK